MQKVIGMGIRFKMPLHIQVVLPDVREHPFSCFGRRAPEFDVEIQHAVTAGDRAPNHVVTVKVTVPKNDRISARGYDERCRQFTNRVTII